MSKSETKPAGQKPTHRIYIVTGEGEKSSWRPIGSAWAHKDGQGFAINVDALPLQGRIVMRIAKDKEAEQQPA